MSYEWVKLGHLISVFCFLGVMGASFYMRERSLVFRFGPLFFSLLTFFFGMSLILKLQSGFPLWALIKGLIWMGLFAFAAACIRFEFKGGRWFAVLLVVTSVAAAVAILKPT